MAQKQGGTGSQASLCCLCQAWHCMSRLRWRGWGDWTLRWWLHPPQLFPRRFSKDAGCLFLAQPLLSLRCALWVELGAHASAGLHSSTSAGLHVRGVYVLRVLLPLLLA